MTAPAPSLVLSLLLAAAFSLAATLQPRALKWSTRGDSNDMLTVALGDARKMFATHFYVKADVYFHGGFYPSIFEQAQQQLAAQEHAMSGHEGRDDAEYDKAMAKLMQPKDWIDRFGRHFFSSTHAHLDKPGEAREILPWLRISAELDPHMINNYLVASYWLRTSMHQPKEAERFLREGLRANPDSDEILFELGSIYESDYHDPERAANLWELALRRWKEQKAAGLKPEASRCIDILTRLTPLEEKRNNLEKAIAYREMELAISPAPAIVQKELDELRQRLAARPK